MYTHNINWKLLKKNKCPNCKKDWAFDLERYPVNEVPVLAHKCGFKIREDKYKEIIMNQVNNRIEEEYRGGNDNG